MSAPRKGKIVFNPLEHFKAHIEADYIALRKLFKTGTPEAFQLMGKVLGDHTVLGTPRGERISGAGAIGLFFEDLWRLGKRDIEFRSIYAWTVPAQRPVPTKHKEDLVTDVGYEITEFHALSPREAGAVANQTGGWARTEGHMSTCVWKP